MKKTLAIALLFTSTLCSPRARADEGMWLYNDPPKSKIAASYGVELTPAWLDHLQRSSVRFNNGGSGSFVSSTGLVLTNHHVASDAIQKLSSQGSDLIKTGFLARTPEQELPAKDLELNVLYEIEDVTAKVMGAVQQAPTPEAAEKARRAAMSAIEEESLRETGLRSDVVTLFRGGAYHLYRYKKYTDVRLVFAPELGIAFYGGDADNFEYPRFCLDMALFRVYEDGKPVTPKDYLAWSTRPLQEGDLTFVSGHPGSTDRLNTSSDLAFLRDVRYPLALQGLRRAEVLLRTFGERGPENKRRAQDDLFGYQNARKAYLGGLEGLQNPALFQFKRDHEKAVKDGLKSRPDLAKKYGDPHADIAKAMAEFSKFYQDYYLLESGRAFNSGLFRIARDIARYRDEMGKPSGERLREYRDSNLESFQQELFSPAPIYSDLEAAKLGESLSFLVELRGADDPLVKEVLQGKSPGRRAQELVDGSALIDVEVRRTLTNPKVGFDDPMLELAYAVDQPARDLRSRYEQQVSGPLQDAYGRLAQLEYELGLTPGYPDATFTLRLAYGPVKGLPGVPAFTTLGGLFEKGDSFGQAAPYTVPESWMAAKDKLALQTPFNFVSTPDITGGNSGSPVVNKDGELVGLIFDGNLPSLVLDFRYEDQMARAVSVDTRAIIEALKNVYDADFLVAEMTQ
jgi:hypothetical protein